IGSGDTWNFFDANSDYFTNGVALRDAGNNLNGAKLYAYIGPCINTYIAYPGSSLDSPSSYMTNSGVITQSSSQELNWTIFSTNNSDYSFLSGRSEEHTSEL